nr:endochitinase A-like [Aegilops tauschii subsp. strangulata]
MVSDDAFDPCRASASSAAAASAFAAVPPPSTPATESPFMASAPLAWARPAPSGSHPPAPRSPLARDASLPRDAALASNSYDPAQPPRDGSLEVNYGASMRLPYGAPPPASGLRGAPVQVPYGGPYPAPYVAPSSPYVASAPYASSSVVPYELPYGAPYAAPVPYVAPLQPYGLSAPVAEPGPFHFAHLVTVKLSADNYLLWRAQVLPLMRSHYLEGYVDGTLPCPPAMVPVPSAAGGSVMVSNPAHRRWIAQDQAILGAIQSSLTPSVAGMVVFAATSRDAWATLDSSFSSQSLTRSSAIRNQLGEVKKNDLSVTAFFNKVKSLADTLSSIGKPLFVMRSLLRSFSMGLMRTMILSLKTLMDVTHRCRLAISMHAFSTPNRGSLLAAPLASTRRALLQTLLSAGAPVVPSRRRRRPQGNEKQAALATPDPGFTPSYSVDPAWYMDTGATDHLTSQLDKLATRQPYAGHDQVRTANGSGTGRGARLELLDDDMATTAPVAATPDEALDEAAPATTPLDPDVDHACMPHARGSDGVTKSPGPAASLSPGPAEPAELSADRLDPRRSPLSRRPCRSPSLRRLRPEVTMYILVYVDDIILVSSSASATDRLVSSLGAEFAVKDLGRLHYFLGLEVLHSDGGLTLTQKKYSQDLLRRAGMLQCKSATTPMSATDKLTALAGDLLAPEDATEYAALWVDCSTCSLLDQTYHLQLTVCASIFIHHVLLTGQLLSASCAMFVTLVHMVSIFSLRVLD